MARSTKTKVTPRSPLRRPLRRSLRLIKKQSFRFSDLPPELRNRIYALALSHKKTAHASNLPELTAGPSTTARALSAVSKRVRAESMGTFYAENTFKFTLYHDRKMRHLSQGKLSEWAATASLGSFATPFLRSLVVGCSSKPCPRHIVIDLRHPTKPVKYLAGGCCISHRVAQADMRAWVLAVLRPEGELELEVKRLKTMLEGLVASAPGFAGKSEETKKGHVEMLLK